MNRDKKTNNLQGFEFHDAVVEDVAFSQKQIFFQFDGVKKVLEATGTWEYVENVHLTLENAEIESMIHQGYRETTSDGKEREVKPKNVPLTEYQQTIEAIPNSFHYIQAVQELSISTGKFKIQFDIGGGGANFGYTLIISCDKFIASWQSPVNDS